MRFVKRYVNLFLFEKLEFSEEYIIHFSEYFNVIEIYQYFNIRLLDQSFI